MKMPDTSQFYAFGRHVVSFAGGAVFYATMFGVVNSTDAANATHAINQISSGFQQIVGGVAVLIPIGMGVMAAVKSSPLAQMLLGAAAMLHGKADPGKLNQQEQATLMEATAKLPAVAGVVTTDKAIAARTSPKVMLPVDMTWSDQKPSGS